MEVDYFVLAVGSGGYVDGFVISPYFYNGSVGDRGYRGVGVLVVVIILRVEFGSFYLFNVIAKIFKSGGVFYLACFGGGGCFEDFFGDVGSGFGNGGGGCVDAFFGDCTRGVVAVPCVDRVFVFENNVKRFGEIFERVVCATNGGNGDGGFAGFGVVGVGYGVVGGG